MEKLRREEELKGRTTKNPREMEQSLLNKVGWFQCHMVLLPLFTDAGHGCCPFTYLDLHELAGRYYVVTKKKIQVCEIKVLFHS